VLLRLLVGSAADSFGGARDLGRLPPFAQHAIEQLRIAPEY
jgi:hypothetical protein